MGWAPSYATVGELAAHVRIGDSLDDAQLELVLAAASRTIDQACNRQFGRVDGPAARYYTARWDPRLLCWFVPIDDLMSQADLVVAFDSADDQTYTGTITNYQLRPVNAFADGRPWTEIVVRSASSVQPTGCADAVRITARWGWLGVPDAIRQACLLQASRFLADRDAPFGVAGSPETGSEVRLLSRLHPDAQVMVRPYRRVWGAV